MAAPRTTLITRPRTSARTVNSPIVESAGTYGLNSLSLMKPPIPAASGPEEQRNGQMSRGLYPRPEGRDPAAQEPTSGAAGGPPPPRRGAPAEPRRTTRPGVPWASKTSSVGIALTSPKARAISGVPIAQRSGAPAWDATRRTSASSDSRATARTARRSPWRLAARRASPASPGRGGTRWPRTRRGPARPARSSRATGRPSRSVSVPRPGARRSPPRPRAASRRRRRLRGDPRGGARSRGRGRFGSAPGSRRS